MLFFISKSIISTATKWKNGDCGKQEIISPMTFIPTHYIGERELERFIIILNKVFQMIYVWTVFKYLYREWLFMYYGNTEIQGILISIYDVYELEKTRKE
jgi:hypothetical protein